MRLFILFLSLASVIALPLRVAADEVDDLRGRVDRLEKEVRELKYTLQALESTAGDRSSRLLDPKNAIAEPEPVAAEKVTTKDKDAAVPAVIPAGQISRKELNDAVANLPVLLSQARSAPYMKHGEAIGVRLFAIREGSLFDQAGLRNGDVVVNANGEPIVDPSQLPALFKTSARREINEIVVLRKGRETVLRYEVLD